MGTNRRRAFTLIEVLIVVVIMAVLAATIIPQFSSSTRDAKDSALRFNVHTMRSQIELYKLHHLSKYPDQIGDATNGYLPQLTKSTDANGNTGAADAAHPYGPYIEGELPPNPFDGKNVVTSVDLGGNKPTAVSGTAGGWQYDPKTGAIWPNNAEYFATEKDHATVPTAAGRYRQQTAETPSGAIGRRGFLLHSCGPRLPHAAPGVLLLLLPNRA